MTQLCKNSHISVQLNVFKGIRAAKGMGQSCQIWLGQQWCLPAQDLITCRPDLIPCSYAVKIHISSLELTLWNGDNEKKNRLFLSCFTSLSPSLPLSNSSAGGRVGRKEKAWVSTNVESGSSGCAHPSPFPSSEANPADKRSGRAGRGSCWWWKQRLCPLKDSWRSLSPLQAAALLNSPSSIRAGFCWCTFGKQILKPLI